MYASISIIDCDKFKKFLVLYKDNYNIIKNIIISDIINKRRIIYTDLCTKELCEGNNCSYTICNNMLDLHTVLKIVNNKELSKALNNSIIYRENDIKLDKKYFNNIKLGGINIIINKKIRIDEFNRKYKKMRFNKFIN